MLKYRMAAAALKLFSLNAATRRSYRMLGNVVGGRGRARAVKPWYLARADANLAFAERHGAIADGMQVMELGTGWVHWESLFTRAFYEVEAVLFDVWDNRQFEAFRFHAAELRRHLPRLTHRPAEVRAKADALLGKVVACTSFEEAYALLGWRYVIEPQGRLDALAGSSIDFAYSSDVMEHVPANTLPRLAADFSRIVKPGGFVTQQIVMADHLCLYDRSAHRKSYLRYDDATWNRWFANDVQHMNRWQHSDFVRLFREAGFAIVAEDWIEQQDASALEIAPRWRDYDRKDLDAAVTRLLVSNTKE